MLAGSGPITPEEFVRLTRMADQAHALYEKSGAMLSTEAWVMDAAQRPLVRERRRAAGDADRLLRVEWALAEMQFEGGGYAWRDDFARVPEVIVKRAMEHAMPRVRIFGVDRFARLVHERQMDPSVPSPGGWELLDVLAASDPDAGVRERARMVLDWAEAFKLRP